METDTVEGRMDMDTGTVRVVLVDDHQLAREGVRRLLGSDRTIEVVGEAESCWEAISLVSRLRPQVVILDVRLRDGNGVEVSRAVRKLAPDCRVLVLSAYDDSQYVVSMVRLGVNGYLTKGCCGEDLIRAVHYAARGWLVFSPDISDRVAGVLGGNGSRRWEEAKRDEAPGEPVAGPPPDGRLTGRESEVLQHVFHGLRNRDIALAMAISPKTVEVHMHRILQKLGARNRSQAIMHSLGLGQPAGVLGGPGCSAGNVAPVSGGSAGNVAPVSGEQQVPR